MPLSVACKQALETERAARKNLARFWNLLYAVSVALALFTIGLIVALAWGNNPAKYLTGLAAIASGGGLAFIVKSKNSAKKDLDAAHNAMRKDCKTPPARGADNLDQHGLPDDAIDILTS